MGDLVCPGQHWVQESPESPTACDVFPAEQEPVSTLRSKARRLCQWASLDQAACARHQSQDSLCCLGLWCWLTGFISFLVVVAPLVQLDLYSLQLLAGFPCAKHLASCAEGPGGMRWGKKDVTCYMPSMDYPSLLLSLQLLPCPWWGMARSHWSWIISGDCCCLRAVRPGFHKSISLSDSLILLNIFFNSNILN